MVLSKLPFRGAGQQVALVSLFALIGVVPATAETSMRLAQVYSPPYSAPLRVDRTLPPHEVITIVRSLGLKPVSAPRARGQSWVVRALGQDGTQVRVVLEATSGRVIEIMRLGPPPPQVVRIIPGSPRGAGRYEDPEEFEELDDKPPVPPGRVPRASGEAPYPGAGPQVITRDSEFTGSLGQRSVDPLLGVPPEFRRGAKRSDPPPEKRIATRPPTDSSPRATPIPRPRPADVPTQAKADAAPAVAPAPAAAPAPKAGTDKPAQTVVTGKDKNQPSNWPPVQALE
jgi:hypothetical protein